MDAKGDWFILLPEGEREGPYTEEDLLDFLDSGELAPEACVMHAADDRVARVGELFRVIEGEAAHSARSTRTEEPRRPWVPAPFPDESTAAPSAPRPLPDRVLYRGHPSWTTYWRSGMFAFVLVGGGWLLREWWAEASGVGLIGGTFSLLWAGLHRLGRCYLVTTRRVEVIHGLVARSSRELQHADIRSVNVLRRGFAGLMGVGTIVFSATGGREDDVVFHRVWRPDRLKELVRKLQARSAG